MPRSASDRFASAARAGTALMAAAKAGADIIPTHCRRESRCSFLSAMRSPSVEVTYVRSTVGHLQEHEDTEAQRHGAGTLCLCVSISSCSRRSVVKRKLADARCGIGLQNRQANFPD